jgi:hypothetical protein
MRSSRLLPAAAAVAILGTVEFVTVPGGQARAASVACYLCVPPPIMCDGAYEWDEWCRDQCGPGSFALSCPYVNEPTGPTNQEYVPCWE